MGTKGVRCLAKGSRCPAPTVKNRNANGEVENYCISTDRPTEPPRNAKLSNCTGTYVVGNRVFRYCIHEQPSYQEVVGGFFFEDYPKAVEYHSLFARLGRLRRVNVRATVQNASPFALLGLVTSAAVEECFFDVFLDQVTVSHALISYADYLRVIDAVVQIGSAQDVKVRLE